MTKRECFIKEGQDPCQPHQVGDRGLILVTRQYPTSQIINSLIIILLKEELAIDSILYG